MQNARDWDWKLFELARSSSARSPHTRRDMNGVLHKPMFPFCDYPDSETGFDKDESKFCGSMQTTFNDFGVCYTFNNVQQFLDENLRQSFSPIKVCYHLHPPFGNNIFFIASVGKAI